MRLLHRSLSMLILLMWFFWLPAPRAQSTPGSSISNARALDGLLQEYAYRPLVRPKTGIPYDGVVPEDLAGIKIAAMRLRSGSLYRYGVLKPTYKEFKIPMGVTASPYVLRLVLVYQNLGNRSSEYYPLPGYTYLTPVLGLLAYDAANLSATDLQELNIKVTRDPISIKFVDVKSVPDGAVAKCVWFDLHGSHNFSNVTSGNTCLTIQQGHFSIVVESIAPPPSISPTPSAGTPNAGPRPSGGGKKNNNSKVGIIVGSVLGGLGLLVLLTFLVLWTQKYKREKKMQQMERAAEGGEALHMTTVGNTKAPAATVTRTQPVLESEYAP